MIRRLLLIAFLLIAACASADDTITSRTLIFRVCQIVIGADNGSALADADLSPQLKQCQVNVAATILEIDVVADAGTPSINISKSHCSTFAVGVCTAYTQTALLSGSLSAATGGFVACSNAGGTAGLDGGTTCSATLTTTTIAKGDWLEITSGTAGGTAKRVSISIYYRANNTNS